MGTTHVSRWERLATSYALGSLSASTEYQWRVRGVNAEGNGAWSATASFTTTAAPVVALSGSASADTSASGQLTVTSPPAVALEGSASAATSASGQLTVTPPAPAGTVALSGAASAATSASGQLTVTPPPSVALSGSASADTSASGQLTVTPPAPAGTIGIDTIPAYQSELVRALIELEPYTIVESGDSLRWYSRFGSENVGSVVTTTPAGDLLIHDVSGTTQDLNLDRIWYVDRGDGTFDIRLNRDPSGNLGTQADFDAFFQGSGGGVGAILAIATEAGTVTIPMESAHWRSIGGALRQPHADGCTGGHSWHGCRRPAGQCRHLL